MKTFVSIIIPVKEINDYLRLETIPAILKQTYQNFEIIILPDEPSKEKFAKTKIIPTFPKTGPADKRDIGAKIAKGEILAFLDDDSYPDKNWLKNAISIFKLQTSNIRHSLSAVCGPSLTPPQNNLRQKASGYVWSTLFGSGGAGNYRCAVKPRREVDDFPTVNLLVKKKDFFQVGGFDSKFWPGEDSLPPDEEVLVVDQLNRLERVKIGNLVDKQLETSKTFKDGKSEVSYKNPQGLRVFSFNSVYKIRTKPIKAFIRHRKFHKVYEVNLSRGNKIKLTDSHSLFTLDKDGKVVSTKIKELKPGSLVVAPRKITISKDIRKINIVQLLLSLENEFIYNSSNFSALYLRSKGYVTYLLENYKEEILEAVKRYKLKGNIHNWKYCGILPLITLKSLPLESYAFQLLKKFKVKIGARGHGNAVKMEPVVLVDEDLLWFLGFMCAEGWLGNPHKAKGGNKWNLCLSQRKTNRIVLDRARKILKSHLGLSFRLYQDKRYNVLNITVNCRVLWCFLQALGLGGYSYQKRVPPLIFSLPKKKIKAFLEGYHAGDSCDYTDGRMGKIGITTSSPEMAKDFALLFLRLGEPFRIVEHKEEREPHYHDQFNIYAFSPSIKNLGVNTYSRMLENLQDGIPAINYLLKIARKYHLTSKLMAMGITPQYSNQRDNRKKVTWYHIERFVKAVKQLVGSAPEIEILERLLNSDLRFEEVLEIKETKNQPRFTYDLSAGGKPGADNFIAGTFVCAHNTKLCHDLVYQLGKKIIYHPQVEVYHHRRAVFGPHLRQISRYALHRGYFAKIMPRTSFRFGYITPSLFVLGLLGGPVLFFVSKTFQLYFLLEIFFFLYILAIFLYLVALLFTAYDVFRQGKDFKVALLMIPSIFLTHLVYGFLFIKGFLTPSLQSKYR